MVNECQISLAIGKMQIKSIKKIITTVGKDMEKLESSYIGGNAKLYSHCRKQSGSSSIVKLYEPAILLLCIYPRDIKIQVHIRTCTQMFIITLFIIAQKQKQPKYPYTLEKIKCNIAI